MKKRVVGKKFSRSVGHRKALRRNLLESLFLHGRITTTLPKAKYIRPAAEKLITRARLDNKANRTLVKRRIFTEDVLKKLFEDIAPKYQDHTGGYTRILKLGMRQGDNTEMAIIELV